MPTFSDHNTTDEDLKSPILGKNISQFKKMMGNHPFEKQHFGQGIKNASSQ
jgi:hypothetical protein